MSRFDMIVILWNSFKLQMVCSISFFGFFSIAPVLRFFWKRAVMMCYAQKLWSHEFHNTRAWTQLKNTLVSIGETQVTQHKHKKVFLLLCINTSPWKPVYTGLVGNSWLKQNMLMPDLGRSTLGLWGISTCWPALSPCWASTLIQVLVNWH